MDKIRFEFKKGIGPMLSVSFREKWYGICFCHHLKERCIKFFGIEKYLCSRCLGILFGGIFAMILFLLGYHISLLLFLIFMGPLLIDGFTQYFSFRKSNNFLRLFTGILFGISINYIGGFIW